MSVPLISRISVPKRRLPVAKRIRPLAVRIADQREKLDRLLLQDKIQQLRAKQRPRRKNRR